MRWQKNPAAWSSHRDLTWSDNASSTTFYRGTLVCCIRAQPRYTQRKSLCTKDTESPRRDRPNRPNKQEFSIRDYFIASRQDQGKQPHYYVRLSTHLPHLESSDPSAMRLMLTRYPELQSSHLTRRIIGGRRQPLLSALRFHPRPWLSLSEAYCERKLTDCRHSRASDVATPATRCYC